MEEVKKKYDIGVIVGRFQIHDLHPEHKKMIDHVLQRHDKAIMFLGCSSVLSTTRNPLDFSARKRMIEEHYSDSFSAILPMYDMKFDEHWSSILDGKIREVFNVGSVVLYGSKDSFIPHYKGRFDTIELVPDNFVSATDVRNEVKNQVLKSREFRAGVIYGAYNTYPTVYSTIDVAIVNSDFTKVLLGKKEFDDRYRFIGGFVDIKDENLVTTVRREAKEETNLEVDDIRYVSSHKVSDWRYRNEPDRSIMTHFHVAKKIFGQEKAGDDIKWIDWFDINSLTEVDLVGEHYKLLNDLKKYRDRDGIQG